MKRTELYPSSLAIAPTTAKLIDGVVDADARDELGERVPGHRGRVLRQVKQQRPSIDLTLPQSDASSHDFELAALPRATAPGQTQPRDRRTPAWLLSAAGGNTEPAEPRVWNVAQLDRAVRDVARGKAIVSDGADGRVPMGGYEGRRVAQMTERCLRRCPCRIPGARCRV